VLALVARPRASRGSPWAPQVCCGFAEGLLKAQRLVPGGPRSRDPFVLASMPGMLVWAVIETALLASLMLTAAAIAVALAIKAAGGGLDQAVG
jgi:hypothetical protein